MTMPDALITGSDWELTSEDARAWAAQYAGQLIAGITQTSATVLQGALSDFIAGRIDYKTLIAQLAPTFGSARANLIAVTEITASFANGATIAAQRQGFDWQIFNCANDELVCMQCGSMDGQIMPTGSGAIPVHPRCRCWWTISVDGPNG